MDKLGVVCLLVIFLMLSCERDKIGLPEVTDVIGMDISEENLVYQFYEKFGFTDLCEHHRILLEVDSFKVNETWQRLPISDESLIAMNSLSNKIDTIFNQNNFAVYYKEKASFSDILLVQGEYVKKGKEKDFLSLNLQKGYYKLLRDTICIYDAARQFLYYEIHSCDAN